jgi:hypothetical protein
MRMRMRIMNMRTITIGGWVVCFLLFCLFGFDHAALVLPDKGLSLTKWSVQLAFCNFWTNRTKVEFRAIFFLENRLKLMKCCCSEFSTET